MRLKRRHTRWAWIAVAISISFVAIAAISPISSFADPTEKTLDHPLADPAVEARARTLMKEIRCVVCQSESISESDADIAADLRNIVREQMAAGHSDQEIEDYLTARYGDFVLLDPPFKARTLILWLGPFALVAVGALGIFAASRKHAKGPLPRAELTPAELTPAERSRLRELLVDGDPRGPGGGS